MATRNFSKIIGGTGKAQFKATGLLLSDNSNTLDVSGWTKARFVGVTSGFSTGNITVTPSYAIADLTTYIAFGTPVAITADGNAEIVAGQLDISTIDKLKFTRGADSNAGAVAVYVILSR